MSNYFYYLFNVSCIFTILYIAYCVLFHRLTFHSVNRALLLLIIVISFIIPAIELGFTIPIFTENAIPQFNELVSLENTVLSSKASLNHESNYITVLFIVYCVVSIMFVLRFVFNAFKLTQLKQNSESYRDNGFVYIYTNLPLTFSFYHWIFIPISDKTTIHETVIQHEKLHAKLGHTIDLMVTEMVIALLWFNPFVYLFRKSIKTVHEYQVDSIIVKNDSQRITYFQLILSNLESQHRMLSLSTYFNGLTIKNRIKMMSKNNSTKKQMVRYLLFLPIIALVSMSFTRSNGELPKQFPIKKTDNYKITSTFGQEMYNQFTKKNVVHNGIDIAAKKGTPIIATASGKVKSVVNKKGWGNLVIIDHGNGYESWYSHLNSFNVKTGDVVNMGDNIGTVGDTGYATGPHLHFEIRKNGKSLDPLDFVQK